MKTRLFLFLTVILPVFTIAQTNPAKNAKTIIGRLYFENKLDSILVVLPEFVKQTDVGSEEWEEMERWLPHTYFTLAQMGSKKRDRDRLAEKADSTWGALDARVGLATGQKYARMQVWQIRKKWQAILDKVEAEEQLRSKSYIMDLYFDAKLNLADTTGFVNELASSVIHGDKNEDVLLLRYYELTEDDSAVYEAYEKHLKETPDSRWPNSDIYWVKQYARFLYKKGENEKALEKINYAIERNEGFNFPFYDFELFKIRAEIHKALGNVEEASHDSTRYSTYQEQLDKSKGLRL